MLKKPSTQSITESASLIGGGVVGAIASDGVVAILPDSVSKYGKAIVAIAALVAAGSVDAKTNSAKFVQGTFIGMAVKQGSEALKEALNGSVPAPKDATTAMGKFQLAALTPASIKAVGMSSPVYEYDFAPVEQIPDSAWDRPASLSGYVQEQFTGV